MGRTRPFRVVTDANLPTLGGTVGGHCHFGGREWGWFGSHSYRSAAWIVLHS
jgi:hypothetical protein